MGKELGGVEGRVGEAARLAGEQGVAQTVDGLLHCQWLMGSARGPLMQSLLGTLSSGVLITIPTQTTIVNYLHPSPRMRSCQCSWVCDDIAWCGLGPNNWIVPIHVAKVNSRSAPHIVAVRLYPADPSFPYSREPAVHIATPRAPKARHARYFAARETSSSNHS